MTKGHQSSSLGRFAPSRFEYVVIQRDVLQDNIILADAKSAALLALSGVLLFHCSERALQVISALHQSPAQAIVLALYIATAAGFIATMFFSWGVIRPRIVERDDHLFWGSKVFSRGPDAFAEAIESADAEEIGTDLLHMLHTLAMICREKYKSFNRAALLAEVSLVLALASEAAFMEQSLLSR